MESLQQEENYGIFLRLKESHNNGTPVEVYTLRWVDERHLVKFYPDTDKPTVKRGTFFLRIVLVRGFVRLVPKVTSCFTRRPRPSALLLPFFSTCLGWSSKPL